MTLPPLEFGSTQMWTSLYEWWRSALCPAPKQSTPAGAEADSPRDAVREELRRLHDERATLQETAASYREFDYDDLAGRVHAQIASIDRRIAEFRLLLRRTPGDPRCESRA